MLEENQIEHVRGADVYGADGDKIGKVGEVYLDDQTGKPDWATVNTGLFGTNESFVPLHEASFTDDRLTVPYDKAKVKDAPNVSTDGHLEPDEERELYSHYGLSGGDASMTEGDRNDDMSGTVGHDTSGPTTDDAMTRSEERLDVGTQTEEVGRARLRKYVVTENVTQTVPVRKEKAVLEREPVTADNVDNAASGPDISEEEHEVTLSEERPVVSKTTEPVERVRLGKQEMTEDKTVTEEVRKEQIEAEGDIANDPDSRR
ncbi:MAG: PRC and DUF2382 domain-containing protein [Propionibacteriales bacterium]|nr:PRC and DUF2382 domain-containing protein [Propionibacteriales bacterium]